LCNWPFIIRGYSYKFQREDAEFAYLATFFQVIIKLHLTLVVHVDDVC